MLDAVFEFIISPIIVGVIVAMFVYWLNGCDK